VPKAKMALAIARSLLYRFQCRKKSLGNHKKVLQKKMFSLKSMTKLEALTVLVRVPRGISKFATAMETRQFGETSVICKGKPGDVTRFWVTNPLKVGSSTSTSINRVLQCRLKIIPKGQSTLSRMCPGTSVGMGV
jgi:hypothetical protein